MSTVKVGVIGLGSISEMHIQSYMNNPEAELIAVTDVNEERAREKAEALNIPYYYTDYKTMLANEEVEAVSICTWNNTHAEIAIAALEAGKHVLIEKPLCKTLEEAKAIESCAMKYPNQLLQIGYVRRFGTNTQVLKNSLITEN